MENKELPPGATEEDVADNIDAKLSPGEFIIPAHVVRFLGLDKLEKMVVKANEQLAELEAGGRIGGEPMEEEEDDVELPFGEDELVGFAEGGLVDDQKKAINAGNTLPQDNGFSGVRQFKSGDQIMYVPFVNGQPLFPVPDEYTPVSDATTAKAPDPTANVPKYQAPTNPEPRARNSQEGNVNTEGLQGNLAGDVKAWTPEDFINYGKQKGSIGEKAVQGVISTMPGGALAWKGRQRYLDKNTGSMLDKMLEEGVDLQGKPITPEMKQDLLNTKTKLAGDLSNEAGRTFNPAERITDMIDKFTSFITGNPTPAPSKSTAPVDTGTSSYRSNPSLSYKSEYDESPNASRSTLDSSGNIATQSAPPSRSAAFGSDNDRPSSSSGRSATGGAVYGKGGLVTRKR